MALTYNPSAARIEIPRKKWFFGLMALFPWLPFGVFAVSGLGPMLTATDNASGHPPDKMFLWAFGALMLGGACWISLSFFRQFISDEPGMVLDSSGITYDVMNQTHSVRWSEIAGLSTANVGKGGMALFVYLKDPHAYIGRQDGFFKRIGQHMALTFRKTPVILQTRLLDISAEELEALVQARLKLGQGNRF